MKKSGEVTYIIYKNENNNFKVFKDAEISIEANPFSSTTDKLKTYYNSGINRISFGLQSTNDRLLKILGRAHNYEDI